MKIISILSALLLFSCQPKGKSSDVKLESEDDKVFYTVGTMFGSKLKDLDLKERELNVLVKGLRHSATNAKMEVEVNDYRTKVRDMFSERMKVKSLAMKKEGEDFLKKFLSEKGVQKTKSGMGYKILKEGNGKNPKATDTVEVHYHGTLIDGTVFDSSVQRGKPVSFPLNRVIKGWTEGVPLIKEGGKIKLVIPSELAYGEHGAPPKIPGGATLVFEIELLKIVKK